MPKWIVVFVALFALAAVTPAIAKADPLIGKQVYRTQVQTGDTINAKKVKKAQAHLAELGFETGPKDGIVGPMTERSMCSFELLYRLKPRLGTMNPKQYMKLMSTEKLRKPYDDKWRYIGISKRCQSLFQVRKHHKYAAIIPVSTGKAGTDSQGRPSFETPKGNFLIFRRVNGWDKSNQYSGAKMWRPNYFQGGKAFHGEEFASQVLPYFASHGCVRTFKHDQNVLWHNYNIGSLVIIRNSRPV